VQGYSTLAWALRGKLSIGSPHTELRHREQRRRGGCHHGCDPRCLPKAKGEWTGECLHTQACILLLSNTQLLPSLLCPLQDLEVLDYGSCLPPSICAGIAASLPQLQGLAVTLQPSSSGACLAALRSLSGLKRLNLSFTREPLPAPLPLHPHMSALSQLVELDVDFDPSSAQLLLAPGLASCASLTSLRLFTLPMDVAAGFSAPQLGHLALSTVHIHDLPLLFDQTRCGVVCWLCSSRQWHRS